MTQQFPFRITTSDQARLIERMRQMAAARIEREAVLCAEHASRLEQSRHHYTSQRDATIASFTSRFATLVKEFRRERQACVARCVQAAWQLYEEERELEKTASRERDETLEHARHLLEHHKQRVAVEYKDRQLVVKQDFEQFERLWQKNQADFDTLVKEAKQIVTRRLPWPEVPKQPWSPGHLARQQHLERFQIVLQRGRDALAVVQHQGAARFVEDGWPVLLGVLACGPLAYGLWLVLQAQGVVLVAALTLLLGALTGVLAWFVARPLAARQTEAALPPLLHAIQLGETEINAARGALQAERERGESDLARAQELENATAQAAWDKTRDEQQRLFNFTINKALPAWNKRRAQLESDYEREAQLVAQRYPQEIQSLERSFEEHLLTLHQNWLSAQNAERERLEREMVAMKQEWDAGWSEFQSAVAAMNEYCATHYPAWSALTGKQVSTYVAPTETGSAASLYPVALRFGHYRFDCREGHDAAASSLTAADCLEFPAALSYPESPSLLFEAEDQGRDVAVESMRNILLRLLTSFPPGKMRFTVIDPVGLGQNFSAFMHLADFDERLISSRIWTESNHINQKLADLTEHMENVIQKYLRNEFASIQEYNAQAGEVAEPFHILVVANFPAGFSDEAARRLTSIASSGARCGVYTLISADMKLKLPRNFDLADLESQATTLCWDRELARFVWQQPAIRSLTLELEEPPGVEQFTHLVRGVGQLSKDAARVEVPFESVLPAPDRWWQSDSRDGIEVPLGRAGAKKLQYMRLGKGTSQHVLISGKTGSGKSTLLNAVITNLAAYYSPRELEFYLIDFKKGVEFKAYATQQLPHARVIAIESEREFGLSVLERLDTELKTRGDLFRAAGVQDVKGYRNATPQAIMPRILLIIDEFQEFFTSDDKIAHDAGLLLDRLVRQGRAFGIHVLLGSQTLAGAYSLARSTLGQMAVRIALQCSESDAHLILSEDNTAARLLSRPGEAIYNDANGLFEGNHPFQVVWLSDHQRETWLQRSAALAREQGWPAGQTTVFEGNVAASAAENVFLTRALESEPATREAAPQAWLGAAVAIKEPTSVQFRRQGGANLLIVGQQEEMALGILHTALVSLAPRGEWDSSPGSLPPLVIVDGSRSDGPDADFWRGPAGQVLPHAKVIGQRELSHVLPALAAEVERRVADSDTAAPPLFLCVYNLARFRELRKSDDFGLASFGSDDDSATPQLDRQFTTILRDGPPHGVHTLLWCDSYNNLNRWMERNSLREFEYRVLFQMSATDSSNLMDHPAASRLGGHMALLYSEELGQAEKFRPYGLPSAAWLEQLRLMLHSAVRQ